MTKWRAAQAKAKFSAVLDCASKEGPQVVTRRGEEFVLLTKLEWDAKALVRDEAKRPERSLWDALYCPPAEPGDPELDLSAGRSEGRWIEF